MCYVAGEHFHWLTGADVETAQKATSTMEEATGLGGGGRFWCEYCHKFITQPTLGKVKVCVVYKDAD